MKRDKPYEATERQTQRLIVEVGGTSLTPARSTPTNEDSIQEWV